MSTLANELAQAWHERAVRANDLVRRGGVFVDQDRAAAEIQRAVAWAQFWTLEAIR
jgi:hypothetical protein